jgi:hypothetical protein
MLARTGRVGRRGKIAMSQLSEIYRLTGRGKMHIVCALAQFLGRVVGQSMSYRSKWPIRRLHPGFGYQHRAS